MVQYDDRFHSRVIQGEFTDEYTFVMDGIVVVVGVVADAEANNDIFAADVHD